MAPVTTDPAVEDEAWELEIGFRYDDKYIEQTADDDVYRLTGASE